MSAKEFTRLLDGLPQRSKPGRDGFPIQAKGVKLWIEGLPLANAGATAKLLYNGLRELNATEVDPGARIEILELLRQPVLFVMAGMEKHVLNQSLPLPAQKRQIGQVIRDFHHELAVGYRISVADLCAPRGAVPFLRGKYVGAALTRAATHLCGVMQKAYLCYAELPPGTLSALHAVMAYAVVSGTHDRLVPDPLYGNASYSPQIAYLQAMLLSIANPYRLTQKEMIELAEAARIWSWQCELRFDGGGQGVFVIDPAADAPPGTRPLDGAFWRLETQRLVDNLRDQVTRARGESRGLTMPLVQPKSRLGQGEALAADLLDRVLDAWGFSGERGHPRMQGGHELDSAIGMQAAHHCINNGQDFNGFAQLLLQSGISLSDRERSGVWAQGNAESARLSLLRVRVLDQSLGGYRIAWEHAETLRGRVGELVVLAPPMVADDDDEPRDWLLGILRWLKATRGDGLEAGVQLLARRAEAVALRTLSDDGRSSVLHRALLLDPLDEGAAPELVVPAIVGSRAAGELLRGPDPYADQPAASITVLKDLKLIENSGGYLRFDLGRLLAPAADPQTAPAPALEGAWPGS
ncbi:MAG: hypothetical protein MUE46_11600 [Xanthomonadales bacterium]|jgi:hypothetical protein|nr:hypothetical protein [Xanthomonadales bacterium]